MCGIAGYIGEKQAYPILMKGLRRLEYRGYDSAGIALIGSSLKVHKCKGKIDDLERLLKSKNTKGNAGIGHTRWATHGIPNNTNAHPHFSESKKLAIVHNGIIENYALLKKEMEKRGHHFLSDTDTEVLIHLIEDIQISEKVTLVDALRLALGEVIGAYAIAILSKDNPDEVIAAKKGSPLVIGIGDGEFYLASDASSIVEHTKNVVYLEDEDIAVLPKSGKLKIKTVKNKNKTPYIEKLEMELIALEKENFEHFMLKEIFEQPQSIKNSMRGRLNIKKATINLGGISGHMQKFLNAKRIIFVACGTSWHAGLVAEYLFEELAGTPVEVEYASEFRYRNPPIYKDDIVIAVSQSGETADTLAAVELAKKKGATVLGVCNVIGSSIARSADAGLYIHAGPEIGVASTKAFTAQIAVLALLALDIAKRKGKISASQLKHLLNELDMVPDKIERVLKKDSEIKYIAEKYKDADNAIYLGRGYGFPTALEGALKLKEISYIHAEGYPAAEMKHGPIALIDENMPVIVVATKGASYYGKVLSNVEEIKARGGKVIALVTEKDGTLSDLADDIIEIPEIDEMLSPLVSIVPLQLLAYHIAVMRGCSVDQPRNLAKSVTVE